MRCQIKEKNPQFPRNQDEIFLFLFFVQQTEVISFIILYDKEKKQILICKKVEPANVLLVSK